MPELTKGNLTDYYDLTPMKDSELIKVFVGKKKSTNTDPKHPPFVVFKQGTGAIKDCEATLALQETKVPGVLPVITRGEDYFIRHGFSNTPATKWSKVKARADILMVDAIKLSLAMLDKGLIDRDRKILKEGDGIAVKNLIICDNHLSFFDFDPEHVIDWETPLTRNDADAIELWKSTHESIIRSLAFNLGLSGKQTSEYMEKFYTSAGNIMTSKGEHAAKLWQSLIHPPEEKFDNSYEPPSFGSSELSSTTVTISQPKNALDSGYMPPDLQSGQSGKSKEKVVAKPMVKPVLPPATLDNIFNLIKAQLDVRSMFLFPLFAPPKEPREQVVEKMAHLAHTLFGREVKVYDELEKMIVKELKEESRAAARGLLNEMKNYLDEAYESQFHDKTDLWESPKGSWPMSEYK